MENLLDNLGLTRSVADACLYYRKDDKLTELIIFHADDYILCATSENEKDFVKKVQKKLDIHDLELPTEILGIQLRKDVYGTSLSTKSGEDNIIDEYEINNVDSLSTPLPSSFKVLPLRMVSDAVVIYKYRRLLGKLLYLSRCVRYDICFAVNLMARYTSNHNKTS